MPIAPMMGRPATAAHAALALAAALACAAAAFLPARATLSPGVTAAAAGGVALLLAAATGLTVRRAEIERARAHARTRALTEMLDSSAGEPETRTLLLGHAGRVAPSAGAVLLSRRDPRSRLEPAFGERISGTPLRGLLVGHPQPEECLAIRLGRTHVRRLSDVALADCTLCGRLAGDSVCEPLRAGGRTLGAVLLASVDPIGAPVREELRDACGRAAPVLALQRTRELAERHAALDPLTGLANRRAAQDALPRLCAHAGRTLTPLAAALVDLDHFGTVNERFGDEQGDVALAAVASTLAAGIRASDFVARYAGQTFLILASDTSQTGGAELAEKLRREVEDLAVAGVGRLTVSVGVAAIPEDAATGEDLLRRAERALGIAKALGRNRVAGPKPSPAPE